MEPNDRIQAAQKRLAALKETMDAAQAEADALRPSTGDVVSNEYLAANIKWSKAATNYSNALVAFSDMLLNR